jgi:hypothetical protein
MLFVVFFLGILRLLEIKDHAVDTVPQPGWRGTVMEDVTKMRSAAAAFNLRPLHPVGVIRQVDDTALADRLIKARPATAALEFGIALEKRIAANCAIVSADLMILFQRTAIRPLGPLLSRDRIDILRKNVLPLVIGQVHRGRVGVRIDRIVGFVIGIHTVDFAICIHTVDLVIRAPHQGKHEKC